MAKCMFIYNVGDVFVSSRTLAHAALVSGLKVVPRRVHGLTVYTPEEEYNVKARHLQRQDKKQGVRYYVNMCSIAFPKKGPWGGEGVLHPIVTAPCLSRGEAVAKCKAMKKRYGESYIFSIDRSRARYQPQHLAVLHNVM